MYITKRKDIDRFEDRLEKIDICNFISRQRPNTKWRVHLITNVKFQLYYSSFLLGASVDLPDFITKQNNAIISFEKEPKHGNYYYDNLCMFRCLTFHKKQSRSCLGFEKDVKKNLEVWCKYLHDNQIRDICNISPKDFEGVSLEDIPQIEKCFFINIDVFEIDSNAIVKSIYKSSCFYDGHMYLNVYQNHLSYITNISRYCRKYVFSICNKHFMLAKKVNIHSKTCLNKTKHQFPGGFHTLKRSIFDALYDMNIIVDEENRFFPFFIVFDFEAMLENVNIQPSEKLCIEKLHRPISVSVCSNVNGYEDEYFILNDDADVLVRDMLTYMEKISDRVYELAKTKWHIVFEKLTELIEKWKAQPSQNAKESDDGGSTCMESTDYEPPSKLFIKRIAKRNVYHDFQEKLQKMIGE